MAVKKWLKKIGKIAAVAAPIVAAPFTGGLSLAAIGALSGAAGAKLSGAGWKGTLLGAGMGAIPGGGGVGGVAKRAVGESLSAAAKRALLNPRTLAQLAAPALPGKVGQVAQYASMFLPGAKGAPGARGVTGGAPGGGIGYVPSTVGLAGSGFGPGEGIGYVPSTVGLAGSGFDGGFESRGTPSTGGAAPTTPTRQQPNTDPRLFGGLFTGRDVATLGAGVFDTVMRSRGTGQQLEAENKALEYERDSDREIKTLLLAQRLEDQQREDLREKSLQARWDADQKRLVDAYNARQEQLAPYRSAGLSSLAKIANLQTPTSTPYAPSMVYRG